MMDGSTADTQKHQVIDICTGTTHSHNNYVCNDGSSGTVNIILRSRYFKDLREWNILHCYNC